MPAPYLTVAELRLQLDLRSESVVSDDGLADLVSAFEGMAERWLGYACRRRQAVEAHVYAGQVSMLFLDWPVGATLDSLEVDGAPFDLDGVRLDVGTGAVLLPRTLTGTGTVVATYTHGLAEPPPALLRACRLFVRREALDDANPRTDNTTTTVVTDIAGGSFIGREATPNPEGNAPTGWRDVDRVLVTQCERRAVRVGIA